MHATKLAESQLFDLSRPVEVPAGLLVCTQAQIQDALAASAAFDNIPHRILLTGSTANGTNINAGLGTSDLDFLLLGEEREDIAGGSIGNTTRDRQIRWQAMRQLALTALEAAFDGVVETKKCLNIDTPGLALDILPSLAHTDYALAGTSDRPVAAIEFWTAGPKTQRIVSHPALHATNGAAKDARTEGRYKDTVRGLKAVKAMLVAEGLDPATAPSHLIECAVYNMPDEGFDGNITETIRGIAGRVLERNRLKEMRTVSNAYRLFGTETFQWQPNNAQAFFRQVYDLLPDARSTAYPTLTPKTLQLVGQS